MPGDVIIQGYQALRTKDLKEAYYNFERGLKSKKKRDAFESLMGLALTYKELGEIDVAVDHLEKALELEYEDKLIYYNLGNIYEESMQHALAIQNYDMAIKFDGDFIDAFVNRGTSWYNLGEMEQAINDFKNALKINPHEVRAISNLGICYLDIGKYEAAIDNFDRALERDPENIHALCGKGLALFNMDQYDESIICFDAAISIKPGFYIANYFKGHILGKLDLLKEAREAIEKAVKIKKSYSLAWFELGELKNYEKDTDGAIKAYRNAIKYQKQFFEEAHFKLGKMLLDKRNDPKEAIKLFKKICLNNPYVPSVWFEMAKALSMMDGKEEKAISSLKNVLTLEKGNSGAIHLMAELLLRSGKGEKAASVLLTGMDMKPKPENGLLLAKVYHSLGRQKDAIMAAEDALSLDPLLYNAWLVMGRSYGALNRKEEYKQCLRKYLNNHPNDEKIIKELKMI